MKSELKNQGELLVQMEASSDPEFRAKIPGISYLIGENTRRVQAFEKRRVMIKLTIEYANKFTREGVYSCRVRNIRGGSVVIEKWTLPATVIVEQPDPYSLKGASEPPPAQSHITSPPQCCPPTCRAPWSSARSGRTTPRSAGTSGRAAWRA